MIVLDTNVVSEMMKPRPAQTVLHWVNEQDAASLYLTAITIGEISYGLRVLPDGKRRRALTDAF